MKNLKMFCTSLEPNHYEFIKRLGYIPAGLGDKNFKGGSILLSQQELYNKSNIQYYLY